MALEIFWNFFLLTITSAVELSVSRGTHGCGWTIYSNVLCMMTPYFSLRYSVMTSASDADEITFWMMVDTKFTAPVFITGWPCFGLFVKKECPTAQLCDFGLERYEESLCIARIV